ncbi:hypothetical protein [Candidatus Nitrosotalea sp. TS]|uniref:hypothetical protein n=1 Tax=Candidatus Nitrosotalea sp. TS TaxID=2341020 RepID=UPI00140A250A|nr:hypothetical protein [Candidatus Nitrosotalea sp. TS]
MSLVFSNKRYLALSATIFSVLLISLSIVSEFIFFSPNFLFYVPVYDITNFSLIVIVAALSGLVISLSIYRIHMLGSGIKRSGTGFLGSIIGASAGACSCGSIGFAVVSEFGAVGGAATAFLTNYEIPLRLISIAILGYTYYVSVKGITTQCKITK